MNNFNNHDFFEKPEDYSAEEGPDRYFLEAQEEIRALYEKDKEGVYFLRQLQVMFEKKYYHWITYNATIQLKEMGYLKDVIIPSRKGASARFFMHHSYRYPKRKINEVNKVIAAYSQDHITRSCGHRAEDLFCGGLAMRGFMPVAKKVREYNGKKWEETGHDLDFVFQRDGIGYGCEIKNTLGYIPKEELEAKIKMCAFFNIRPLFIMRWSPKTYNYIIIKEGGFALLFESQIYELSQVELVKKIKEILNFPVDHPKAIPDGIIDRFVKWHEKNL